MFNLVQETFANMASLFSFCIFFTNHFPHTVFRDNIVLSIQGKAKNNFQTNNFPSGHRAKEIQPLALRWSTGEAAEDVT